MPVRVGVCNLPHRREPPHRHVPHWTVSELLPVSLRWLMTLPPARKPPRWWKPPHAQLPHWTPSVSRPVALPLLLTVSLRLVPLTLSLLP